LGNMAGAVEAIKAAIAGGKRICVHGDYDADGICATALAVLILRELGADVTWHLPSRFEEGYGLQRETLARLAEEGCGLVLTVDCGVTAVEEIAEARARGLEVVVTDHHRPGETLPDCPVVATRPSDYPFPELCGTGVVYKLGEALLGLGHEALTRHLDLVALATISDVVPLVDENRALALAGLRALARTQKPGLRALMKSARVDPARVDEGAVGFRLAPRINASGRLCRPGAALELLLTEDSDEAGRLAHQLEELNRERQGVEDRILRDALAKVEEWPEEKQRHRGYVLADEGWHEGVIGIVASRLVERFHRPVVLIAGGGDGWKGSGRSTGAFDLHGGLAACARHLERFGGHRAAAGLSILPENVDAFADAFAAHADSVLTDDDLRARTVVDAVVSGGELTLALCGEVRRLAPFGLGNPGVTLLLPSCELADLATVGDGKHLRFRVHDRDRSGSAIAFGLGSQLDRFRRQGRYDVAFRLEENHWNGTVAPQLVVRRVFDAHEGYEELRDWLATQWSLPEAERAADAAAVFSELGLSGDTRGRRPLLESGTFRAMLDEPALARAA
ncbi:MAG TPA: single-stranded-DNA-specific exonuclease RecJ, partial [Gaiellaceae bacterium]|nr:single-stranded-DNA-specific exonuclease RecJ [Gaiellaceae bacterium]